MPKPTRNPAVHVPPLSLGGAKAEEDAWQALDGIAAWPRADLRDFAAAHEDICVLFAQGALQPSVFQEHMLQLPTPIRSGLKWYKRHWDILPPNTEALLEKISMLICEGEVFWTLHGC